MISTYSKKRKIIWRELEIEWMQAANEGAQNQ